MMKQVWHRHRRPRLRLSPPTRPCPSETTVAHSNRYTPSFADDSALATRIAVGAPLQIALCW